jgi:hypothetical protein
MKVKISGETRTAFLSKSTMWLWKVTEALKGAHRATDPVSFGTSLFTLIRRRHSTQLG